MSRNQNQALLLRSALAGVAAAFCLTIPADAEPLSPEARGRLEGASLYTLVYTQGNGSEVDDAAAGLVIKKWKGYRGAWTYLCVTLLDRPESGSVNYSLRRPEGKPRVSDRQRGHDAKSGLAAFEFYLRDAKGEQLSAYPLGDPGLPKVGDVLHAASIEGVAPGKIFPDPAEVIEVEVLRLVTDAEGETQWIEVAGDLGQTLRGGAVVDSDEALVGILHGPVPDGSGAWQVLPAARLDEMMVARREPLEFEVLSNADRVTLNLRGKYWNPRKELPSVRLLLADAADLKQKPARDEAGRWRPIVPKGKQHHFTYNYTSMIFALTLAMPDDGGKAKYYGQLVEKRKDKPDQFLEPFELEFEREEGRWGARGLGVFPAVPRAHPDVSESKEPVVALAEAEVVDLPSPLRDVYLAHGGDQLLLLLAENPRLAVFDLPSRKIVASADLETPRVSLAASREAVYLGHWDGGRIERRALADLKAERESVLGEGQGLISLAAGWDAVDAPLFVTTTTGPLFLDPRTLEQIGGIEREGAVSNYTRHPLDEGEHDRQARASGDGAAFAHWFHTGRDREVGLCYLSDDRLFLANPQRSSSVRLTRHGDYIFGVDKGIAPIATSREDSLRSEMRTSIRMPRAGFPFPSLEGTTFLTHERGSGSHEKFSTRPLVGLHARSADGARKLATLDGFSELPDLYGVFGPPIEKRILFFPEAGLIVTLPTDNRRIFIREFRPGGALAEHKITALALRTLPSRQVRRGQTVEHSFASYTSPLLASYDLIDGPEGATLSKDGLFRWEIPAGFVGKQAVVRMQVRGSEDNEVTHIFRLHVVGADPLVAAGAPPETPPLSEMSKTIEIGESGRPVIGGGGRYLIFPGQRDATVRVFDMKTRSVVASTKLASADFMIAANRDALFVYLKTQRILERRKLPNLEREKVKAAAGVVRAVDMTIGSHSSETPLVLASAAAFHFIRPDSLADAGLEIAEPAKPRLSYDIFRGPFRVRAAADGRSMVTWGTGSTSATPVGLRLFGDEVASVRGEGRFPPGFSPAFTEALTYSADGGTLDAAFERSEDPVRNRRPPVLVPGLSGYTYLSVQISSSRDFPKPSEIGIHAVDGKGELMRMTNLLELDANAEQLLQRYRYGGIEERIFYSPEFATLVTMPDDGKIVVRELPLAESLEKIGSTFAFVRSGAPARFEPGQRFSHQIELASSAPELPKFALIDAPEGMVITPAGLITWQVPAGEMGWKHNVIVEIQAAPEQLIYSSFVIHRNSAPEPPPSDAAGAGGEGARKKPPVPPKSGA